MIITRTPFRVSFFGGGTDYPPWFREHGGAVLSTSIDKYCYLACRYLPPFFDVKYRTVYQKTELTNSIADIEHPAVRACLDHMSFHDYGTEVVHYADLPSRTGLGSSSSFSVGLLHALSGLKGQMPSKRQLAEAAIHVEQNMLKENVGSQDQVAAAFGGLNLITFEARGFELRPMTLKPERLKELQDSLLLVYTGISRLASEVAAHQVRNIDSRKRELFAMREMVDQAVEILTSGTSMSDFGRLLHESWMLKRSLSTQVSNDSVDGIYDRARAHGALGGKLLGAGGGGFMLLFAAPENRARIVDSLPGLLHVPFSFENLGTQVVYFHPQAPI
jgi:D-glycero-alpha-D-manno-heptose-7-phosphate kinase